ncbi:MAG TPA: hypothetical protein PLX96_04855 [Candidatus Omnitrophota bacterium]|jgi:hypothetical protein|nr:hypothetical protein [Candidatus Omnitrophota bacterium]
MKKQTGLVVVLIVVAVAIGGTYYRLNVKADKTTLNTTVKSQDASQGSGIPFPEKMNQLSRNMSLWGRLSPEEKTQAVDAVIALYRNRDNIAILNTGEFYVGKIDETIRGNPPVANMDIMTLMRILSIMEYDFYNGQNKDELARNTLGDKGYEDNRTRRRMTAMLGAR